MKICMVQTRPLKGDLQANIADHQRFIDRALVHGAALIIFPELSLTGYEPTLADALATHRDDPRLDDFQTIADSRQVTIGVGLPTKSPAGICISMVLFRPHQARHLYSKQYLHADEEPFFVSGQNASALIGHNPNVALAICYELSVPAHAATAVNSGAELYIASVAKTAAGVESAGHRLAEIARHYAMPVLLSNCVGPCDDFEAGGRSAVWNAQGELVGQLDGSSEGMLVYDTVSLAVVKEMS